MCCYTDRTHTPEFYTVSNGIVDKFMYPLLLPSTIPHGTGNLIYYVFYYIF